MQNFPPILFPHFVCKLNLLKMGQSNTWVSEQLAENRKGNKQFRQAFDIGVRVFIWLLFYFLLKNEYRKIPKM